MSICIILQAIAMVKACSIGNHGDTRTAKVPSRTIRPPGAKIARNPISHAAEFAPMAAIIGKSVSNDVAKTRL